MLLKGNGYVQACLSQCDIARLLSRHLYWTKTKAYMPRVQAAGIQSALESNAHLNINTYADPNRQYQPNLTLTVH